MGVRPSSLSGRTNGAHVQSRNCPRADLVRRSGCGNMHEQTQVTVKMDQWRGAPVVSLQPHANRFRPIILPLKQLALTAIATVPDLRRPLRYVIDRLALLAGAPSRQASAN